MKKDLGSVLALYPTPTTVVGTMVDGKVNWIAIAHVGIIAMDCISISSRKTHYSNKGIKESGKVSVNLVSEDMLTEADYVGIASGNTADKSKVFTYQTGQLGAPVIDKSPLAMECEVVGTYDTPNHDVFILKIIHTYAEESVLDGNGKIDFEKVRPVLFEMPSRSYMIAEKKIAKAWEIGKGYKG